jgi:hypothetical protein
MLAVRDSMRPRGGSNGARSEEQLKAFGFASWGVAHQGAPSAAPRAHAAPPERPRLAITASEEVQKVISASGERKRVYFHVRNHEEWPLLIWTRSRCT